MHVVTQSHALQKHSSDKQQFVVVSSISDCVRRPLSFVFPSLIIHLTIDAFESLLVYLSDGLKTQTCVSVSPLIYSSVCMSVCTSVSYILCPNDHYLVEGGVYVVGWFLTKKLRLIIVCRGQQVLFVFGRGIAQSNRQRQTENVGDRDRQTEKEIDSDTQT